MRWSAWFTGSLLLTMACLQCGTAAEPAAKAATVVAAEKPYVLPEVGAAKPTMVRPGPFRPMSPGTMKTIDPLREIDETVSRHDVVELLAADGKLDFAKNVAFRRDIWALEFKFKPLRMIDVDLPQPSGFMQRKPIWYLIYSISNNIKTMHPVRAEDGTYNIEYVDAPVHLSPGFLLHSVSSNKWYPERDIPAALAAIRTREDPNRAFCNMAQIPRDLKVGETVWGIATWEDIDPRTERFSIYVSGLTNAYRWSDDAGKFKTGARLGTGRHLVQKTLKLNFWRPGDEYNPTEREIRFGVPGELDYEWVYR